MIKCDPVKRTVSPEKVQRILAKHGTRVTVKEAKLILDFIYNFSILSVNQVIRYYKSMEYENSKYGASSRS